MKILAFINQKGGVGKTTSAVEIASRLASSRKKVLAIDADPQANMTFIFGLNPDQEGQNTLKDVFSKTVSLKDAAILTKEGVHLVPNNILMSGADRMFYGPNSMNLLKDAIRKSGDEFDYIIIDSPPSLGIINWNVLIAADYLIVPVNANALSIQGLRALADTINEVRENANPNLKILGLLVTRYNPRTRLSKEAVPDLEEIAGNFLGTRVFRSMIRQSVAVEDAQANRKSTSSSKASAIRKDYDELCNEIINILGKEKQ